MKNENSFVEKLHNKTQNKTKSVLLLFAIFIFLVFLSLLASFWYNKQAIKTIKISGNTVLTAGEINAIIDEKIMNIPSEGIELEEIRRKIISHEYVADAYVWFNSKGVLGIEIKERVPIGIVVNSDGKIVFVDQTGAIFQYRLYKEYTDLPIISNVHRNSNRYGDNSKDSDNSKKNSDAKKIDKIILAGALEIVSELQNSFSTLNNIISEIKFNTVTNNYELYLTEANIKVNFGKAENITQKMDKIYTFWKEKILLEQDKSAFRNIDVQWNNIVVVKK